MVGVAAQGECSHAIISTVGTPLVIFVAMPGTDLGPHATWRNTAEIKQYLYEPVANQVEAALGREVDLRIEKDKIGQGVIHRSMFNEALRAPVYIADLTGANANVYLELGVRWALRDRVTVLVCQNEEHDIKFNVSPSRAIRYGPTPSELESAREKIVRAILEGLAGGSDGVADSLVRQHLDVKELHSGISGIHPEPTGRHAPDGRLLRYFRTRARTPVDRKNPRRRRTVSTLAVGYLSLAMIALLLGVFLGASYGGTEDPPARRHEIGDAYRSSGEEFLAQFVNQSSGKCIARNRVASHGDNAEIPGPTQGADIYQYACSTGLDFAQTLVLVPLKDDSWMIRSSVKINLCLEAAGTPHDGQQFQFCNEGDDRQEWMLQSVRYADPQVVLVRNRQTDLCLSHGGPPGGLPDSPAEFIPQRPCLPELEMEWLIKTLPPVGARECPDRQNIGIKNHETAYYVNPGDSKRPLLETRGQMMSLEPAGQSVHGCTVQIFGSPESCMAAPAEGSPDSEVIWTPCNKGRPDQLWVVVSSGKLDGRNWLQFHPIHDANRCLRQSEKDIKTAKLTAPQCGGARLSEWAVE